MGIQFAKQDPWYHRVWGRVLIGLTGLVLLLLSSRACGSTEGAAKEACRGFVEDRLIAPSTAEFSEEEVSEDPYQRRSEEGQYLVTGSVDSENGNGAMVRSTYRCTVVETDGQWELVEMGGPYSR